MTYTCTLDSVTQQIQTALENLNNTRLMLRACTGPIDKEISNHYHVLELAPMSAPQIAKITKSLRLLLRERREIKESLSILDSTLANADMKDITVSRAKSLNKNREEAMVSFNRIMEN